MTFPRTLAAITPGWLSAVLGGAVEGFVAEPVGFGLVSEVSRLRINWSGAGGGPASVIVKLPGADLAARRMAASFGHYRKEAGYYAHVALHNPISSPAALFCAYDGETDEFVLLLEDLAEARSGDQLAGLSPAEATAAIEALAAMQARWWRSADLGLEGLTGMDDPSMNALEAAFADCWPGLRAAIGEALSTSAISAGERFGPLIGRLRAALAGRPASLVHGDYRADNFLFGPDGEFAVVDWQIVRRGPAIHDLANLLVGSLDIGQRRAQEPQLLRLYLDRLAAGGVAGYGIEEAWRDYRASVLFAWIWPVMGAGSLAPESERARSMFRAWHSRVAAAIDDLDPMAAVEDLLADAG